MDIRDLEQRIYPLTANGEKYFKVLELPFLQEYPRKPFLWTSNFFIVF